MAPKTRVAVRLKEAIGGSKSMNRSADLDALVDKFKSLQTKLKNLVISLKSHHASMQQMAKTRMEVANNIAILSEKSPLHDCAGRLPTPENSSILSYRSVHMDFSKRAGAYTAKYNQYIVDYAIEWDKVVTSRVSAGIKEAEQLRRDLDHYQGKVESLRQSSNKTLAAGKQVDAKTAERLSRNEEKLIKSKEHYNRYATDMCILIEEVTERSWKDLHPMLVKLAQFDSTMSGDEAKALSSLNQVVSQLKGLADQHGLTPQARLKDLAQRKPSEISTAKNPGGGLAIESGGAFGSGLMGGSSGVTSSVYGEQPSLAPGTVSPQGMGGFPVAVSSDTNGAALDRVSSQGSFGSGVSSGPGSYSNYNMTTSDMLAVSAASAPPPSMEQVQDATSGLQISSSRPRTASGNSFPPLAPTSGGSGMYHRSSSIASNYSNDSGSLGAHPAPAPAAPPPPPPPAMGISMYSSYGGNDAVPMASAVPMAPDPSAPYATGSYGGGDPAPAHPWSTGGGAAPKRSTNPFEV